MTRLRAVGARGIMRGSGLTARRQITKASSSCALLLTGTTAGSTTTLQESATAIAYNGVGRHRRLQHLARLLLGQGQQRAYRASGNAVATSTKVTIDAFIVHS